MLRALCTVRRASGFTRTNPDVTRRRPKTVHSSLWLDSVLVSVPFLCAGGQTVIVEQNISKHEAPRTPSVPPPPNREQGYQDVEGARGNMES